ncbi:hypothetical protein D3C83_292440 [compost metagenome]
MDGKQVPAWLRVPVGGCATVENGGAKKAECSSQPGVHRLRLNDAAFSGGWLIVDPMLP